MPASKVSPSALEEMPAKSQPRKLKPQHHFMWVSGIVGILLFLTPGFYVLKYYAVDKPGEDRQAASISLANTDSASQAALSAMLADHSAHNLALLCRLANGDANQQIRLWAIVAIGTTVRAPGTNFKYPMECLLAKSTLSDLATHDPNPTVRTTASNTLGKIAQHGAVIER